MKKKVLIVASMILMALTVSGCMKKENPVSTDSSQNQTTKSAEAEVTGAGDSLDETKTLVITHGAYPQTLDIQNQSDAFSSRPASMVFEKLMKMDKDGNFQGVLAESWEYEDDTHLVFHLREGVKFHNGDPMTAEDVK